MAQIRAGTPCQCSSSPVRFKRPRPEPRRIKRGDAITHSFIEGGYHSRQHMDPCTTRSDDCTSFFGGQPVGSPDTIGGSSNLGTSAECIRNRFSQLSTATSATLASTCDHAIGVSFCCAPYCQIFIIHTSTYFEYHFLKLNLNLRNPRLNSVQTNFCFYRTIQHGNKLNLSYVSINGIGSFVATRIYDQLYEVWSSCGNS